MTKNNQTCTCMQPCTMSVRQTAQMMKCSKTTVLRNIRKGKLNAKMKDNAFQVRTTSVLKMMKKR